ncbi:1-acyl-sn-glycerol-3-phosphate acyltransferase [Planctomicrobium piriforme]|uniref:Acyltransferase n=1 Tax=Planctomicrobium piriforme TaxID=1576369 RepID=A0A1I3L5Y2_9PLAN|nr:1-acyl-sn-glycerol-3-phosphate acyltransferase [Planctomicrobium piriforme]SFI79825.1 Acyltransferase [Planctomicrobium piriforme]
MNPQPYQTPPRWWPSRLSPLVVRWFAGRRRRELREQGITRIDVRGTEAVADALRAGQGVLLVSNHSYHFDSYVLIESGLRGGWHPHIMTAWQVFMMYGRYGQWSLQRHGCFSINREGTDTQALKQALSVLTAGPHPLVIFPEGDIYHSNDRVMPFREGAAALALLAARQQKRPIVAIPCAMKCFYTVDPTPELRLMMDRLEAQIRWRPTPDLPLLDRIYRFGHGMLSLKELEYLGHARTGSVRERILFLSQSILEQVRERRSLILKGHDLTERIRHLRSQLIKQIDSLRAAQPSLGEVELQRQLRERHVDLEDLFFATQLSSYHGDYTSEHPTPERLAETIDKFEEDVFALQAPTPRGERRAVVRFGEPIPITADSAKPQQLTLTLERQVQGLLDQINSERDTRA